MQEVFESFAKSFLSLMAMLVKKMLSLRACGTSFDPIVTKLDDGSFGLQINIYPGRDEVVFTELSIPGCDIAEGFQNIAHNTHGDVLFRYRQITKNSAFAKDSMKISAVIPPAVRNTGPEIIFAVIRPRGAKNSIRVTLRGGWLNCLTTKRSLI